MKIRTFFFIAFSFLALFSLSGCQSAEGGVEQKDIKVSGYVIPGIYVDHVEMVDYQGQQVPRWMVDDEYRRNMQDLFYISTEHSKRTVQEVNNVEWQCVTLSDGHTYPLYPKSEDDLVRQNVEIHLASYFITKDKLEEFDRVKGNAQTREAYYQSLRNELKKTLKAHVKPLP